MGTSPQVFFATSCTNSLYRFPEPRAQMKFGLLSFKPKIHPERMHKLGLALLTICLLLFVAFARGEQGELLPGTKPLTLEGDLSAQMVDGIDKFLLRAIDQTFTNRAKTYDAGKNEAESRRSGLRKIIGAVDERVASPAIEVETNVAETDLFTVQEVRWPVFAGVHGEGLLLRPKSTTVARVIAIPDADQTPEMIAGVVEGVSAERQFARRLAEHGCEVLTPVLINRDDAWSGSERLKKFTNQPHREWIYRQAYELGRHIIGYEVEKVLAGVDAFESEQSNSKLPIGVAGYAEGGLIAFYSAALDPRIKAALVSGYFGSQQRIYEQPIYRNIFGLLENFGDAEVANLIAPRALIVEYSVAPKISGPPTPHEGRNGAAPGKLQTPEYESVEMEVERARQYFNKRNLKAADPFTIISGNEGMATGPCADRGLAALLNGLGMKLEFLQNPGKVKTEAHSSPHASERQHRQVKELEDFTQEIFVECAGARSNFFWNKIKATSPQEWEKESVPYRKIFWEQTIGKFPAPDLPLNPRSRRLQSTETNISEYEVVLDVFPDVFAWGYLLVPNDIKKDERRPVVVCQHGLEGLPEDVISTDTNNPGFHYYKGFGTRLAQQRFIVFVPHNPYRGGDKFRQLQRKANPLGKSLFSIIFAQHEKILEWLSQLPFADSKRIAFYGLSYGGKSAMRIPAVLDNYALSICSGDFNEWVKKNVSLEYPGSYMFTGEYEMPEWDLGHTFDYAEMAALIAPRPFMVERGHHDPVGLDEWVGREYARVGAFYDHLGIPERTRIEYFEGPHTIHGMGTFEFLHKQLNFPQ